MAIGDFIISNDRVIVYPPPPRKPVKVILPFATANNLVPSGAAISTPL